MLSTNHAEGILAVDLGKTRTRARHLRGRGPVGEGDAPGAVGLAGHDGVAQVVHAVDAAAAAAGLGPDARVGVLTVGLAGYESAAHLRDELAARLAQRWGATVVLCSDVTAAHAGALAGGPGVVLAAGTGAVALGVSADGTHARRDGWGYLLGDDGSGFAVGRAGLRAALAHAEGRGGSAVLARAASEWLAEEAPAPVGGAGAPWSPGVQDGAGAAGAPLDPAPADPGALPAGSALPAAVAAAVHADPRPARRVASFAPHVARAAAGGDEAAGEILAEAGRALAATALACRNAVDPALTVALTGGLTSAGEALTGPLTAALRAGGATVAQPAGTALDGAELLARAVQREGAAPPALAGLVTVCHPAHTPADRAADEHETADASGLSRLATEGARADLLDLDRRPTREILAELWRAEAEVPRALLALAPQVAAAADAAAERLRAGGRMFYLGAGTPARLAFVDASELPPTFGTPYDLVQALTAGGPDAVLQAREGAEDDGPAGVAAVAGARVGPSDVVVGLTASGRTPFVVEALREARGRGALTISLANNPGSEVSALADHPIEVLTGAEVISGSTRLKAGTAQKLFLNGLSTAVMIRLGKTFGPYMVDMRATNHKLRVRAERMVRRVTGAGADEARAALEAADWSTTVAIVMILRGLGVREARAALAAGGSVRGALEGEAP